MNVVEIRIGSNQYLAFNPAHVKIEESDLEKDYLPSGAKLSEMLHQHSEEILVPFQCVS